MNIGKFQIGISRIIILGVGVSMGFTSAIIGWGGYDAILRFSVSQAVRLVQDSPVWYMWQGLPMPIYANVYFFNVTNADQLSEGVKPRLRELGPYVYSVDYEKYDISVSDDENTIGYRQNRTYFFEPEMSKGKETDLMTLINVAFITLSNMAHNPTVNLDADALEKLDRMLTETGESLTKTATVREFLFDGISLQNYLKVLKNPLFEGVKLQLPQHMQDGQFAIFKGKNHSHSGRWVVRSGIGRPKDFGRVMSINGKTKLTFWKADWCNALNGTDGMNYQPFISPGITKLSSISMEVCRSLKWNYDKEDSSPWGIPVSRYRIQKFHSVKQDPDSWCFCPHDDTMKCNITGIGSAAPCFGGLPFIFSKPHFLAVDSTVAQSVQGLSPKPKRHDSYADLNALTGAPIDSFFRVQYSMELMNWSDLPSFSNVHPALVPFVWIEQVSTLDFVNKVLILVMEMSRQYIFLLRWLLTASFGFFIIVGLGLIFRDGVTKTKVKTINSKSFVTDELGQVGIKT